LYLGAVQKCSDARRARTVSRGVYKYTLNDAVCSATPASAGVNSADGCFVKPFRLYRQGMSLFIIAPP
jgi:hypothetical protein